MWQCICDVWRRFILCRYFVSKLWDFLLFKMESSFCHQTVSLSPLSHKPHIHYFLHSFQTYTEGPPLNSICIHSILILEISKPDESTTGNGRNVALCTSFTNLCGVVFVQLHFLCQFLSQFSLTVCS